MRKTGTSLIAAGGLLAALCAAAEPAQAQSPVDVLGAAAAGAAIAAGAPYPYLYGGQRYCWYDAAWNGPGWYYCGYAYRRGFGWGGGHGWRGWAHGGGGPRGPGGGRGGPRHEEHHH